METVEGLNSTYFHHRHINISADWSILKILLTVLV